MTKEEPSETSRSIQTRLDAQWVVGFTDGEGCFTVGMSKHPEMTQGMQVLPEFVVVQHERDIQILYALKTFFGCGVVRRNNGDRMCLRVRKLDHLHEIINPFFMKHQLKTKKKLDFLKFRKIVMMMKENKHLEKDGIEKIKQIAETMNKGVER